MGRPRKPTAVRKAEGVRGHRPLNENEPQPTPTTGRVPAGLSTWGKRAWADAVEELDRLNLLTVVDQVALEAAICGADQAHEADRRVRLLQALINRGKAQQEDYYRLSIMNSVSKKGWNQYKAFATEFGMTPASRTRLSVDPVPAAAVAPGRKAKIDPIEDALCGPEMVQ